MPRRHDNTADTLQVDGSLPMAMSGSYLWIEPNSGPGPRIHTVTLHAGTAVSYRHRLIDTPAPNGHRTTNLIVFAGRVIALADGARAHELDDDLRTTAADAAGQELGVGAYPKTDLHTGELHLISSPGEAAALHHVLSGSGMTRRTHPIADAPAPVLDLALTAQRLLLFADGFTGVTDRHRHGPISWLVSKPTQSGRIVDAHDDQYGRVVVYLVDQGLERWTLDASTAAVECRTLDATRQHPSRFNEQFKGLPHRYLYGVGGHQRTVIAGGPTLFKHDVVTGTREQRGFGDGRQGGEFVFAVDPARALIEDDGWLLGLVHDEATRRSHLLVLDAGDIAGPPVATIQLPRPITAPLRGLWISSPERPEGAEAAEAVACSPSRSRPPAPPTPEGD